jgi:hypothetical protein
MFFIVIRPTPIEVALSAVFFQDDFLQVFTPIRTYRLVPRFATEAERLPAPMTPDLFRLFRGNIPTFYFESLSVYEDISDLPVRRFNNAAACLPRDIHL